MISSSGDGQGSSAVISNGSQSNNGSTVAVTPVGTVSVVDVQAHQGLTGTDGDEANAAVPVHVPVRRRSCDERAPANLGLRQWVTHPRQTFNTWWYGENARPVSVPDINTHDHNVVDGLAATESRSASEGGAADQADNTADTTEGVNQGNDIHTSESLSLSNGYVTPPELPEDQEPKMTCCDKMRAFCILICTVIKVLWEKIKTCLYQCFCCRSGVGVSDQELIDSLDIDVTPEDTDYAVDVNGESAEEEVFSEALIETREQSQNFRHIVRAYYLAFLDYSNLGFFHGIARKRDKVNGIINKAKAKLYEYARQETKAIILSNNANRRSEREIENDVYSYILKTAMAQLNFTEERIKETYTIFHQALNGMGYPYLVDKPNGDCILIVKYYGMNPFESHLPYSAAAYRKAIRELAAERGVDVTNL
ncbi:hypothetical protein ElyMa_006018400 [Elysia marginata]|uniref:Uncharacterized protein n=1 Tax=Elysia marginata TaxID=1093978 RepID=A0AAV4GHU1_9GAST|nr:hypothetical protein ElyMa_006018400 [Elysia marginata]